MRRTMRRRSADKWANHILGKAAPVFFRAIVGLVLAGTVAVHGEEKRLVPDTERRIIVLDPGHGGSDNGARGLQGTYEKDVTLVAARMLADQLRNRYTVALTRSDDYGLDISRRTALANHRGADVFLSLHTGAHFLRKAAGIIIYTYQEIPDPDRSVPLDLQESGGIGRAQENWDQVQIHHRILSRQLQTSVFNRICGDEPDRGCRKVNAPLVVLMGADMPAILMEIGHITNPVEERKLQDKTYLTDLVQKIALAIDDYFSRTTPSGP